MNLSRLIPSSLLAAGLLLAANARASDALVTFDDMPAASSGQVVDINLPHSLLVVAALATDKSDHETAELLRHLQSVRVNVVKLDAGNRAEAIEHIRRVRESLKDWRKVVSVRQPNGEDVDIRMKCRADDTIEGFVITVIQPDQNAVFINVVGDLKPDQLGRIVAHFQIPGMPSLAAPKHA